MPSAHAELRVIRWVRGRPVGGHAMRRWASVLTRAMRSPFVAADRLLAFSRRWPHGSRLPTRHRRVRRQEPSNGMDLAEDEPATVRRRALRPFQVSAGLRYSILTALSWCTPATLRSQCSRVVEQHGLCGVGAARCRVTADPRFRDILTIVSGIALLDVAAPLIETVPSCCLTTRCHTRSRDWMLPMAYVGDTSSRPAHPTVKIASWFTLLDIERVTGHQAGRSQR
jgi:hypothetical protein